MSEAEKGAPEKIYLGNSYSEFAQFGEKIDENPGRCKCYFVV